MILQKNKQKKAEEEFDEKDYHTPIRRWSEAQNIKYSNFLLKHLEQIESPEINKQFKMFSTMSKTVFRSKSSAQCKSHHQKMMKSYGSIRGIIAAFLPSEAL